MSAAQLLLVEYCMGPHTINQVTIQHIGNDLNMNIWIIHDYTIQEVVISFIYHNSWSLFGVYPNKNSTYDQCHARHLQLPALRCWDLLQRGGLCGGSAANLLVDIGAILTGGTMVDGCRWWIMVV